MNKKQEVCVRARMSMHAHTCVDQMKNNIYPGDNMASVLYVNENN
jgi:hypothetical protein